MQVLLLSGDEVPERRIIIFEELGGGGLLGGGGGGGGGGGRCSDSFVHYDTRYTAFLSYLLQELRKNNKIRISWGSLLLVRRITVDL